VRIIFRSFEPSVWKVEILRGLLSSLVIFCATFAFKKGKQFFEAMNAKLDVIKDNHLTHIEGATSRTAELMEKMWKGRSKQTCVTPKRTLT
jgi:hypothetical protein